MRTNSSVKRKTTSVIFIPFLFILTFVLILFNKTDYYLVNKVKGYGIDYVSPITRLVSFPVTFIGEIAVTFSATKNSGLK